MCATKEHRLYGLSGVSHVQFRNRSRLGLGQAITWRQLACRKVIVCRGTQYHRRGFHCFVVTLDGDNNTTSAGLSADWIECLTSKMSRGGKWRRSCVSRNCDIYRSWLHRVVRPNLLSVNHTHQGLRDFWVTYLLRGFGFGSGAGDFVEYWLFAES